MKAVPEHLKSNPLVNPSKQPHDAPALAQVKDEHFMPALEYALESARTEINNIKNNPTTPTFENTILAMEYAGTLLSRVSLVFSNISLANTNDALQAMGEKINVMMTQYSNEISMDADLFKRIKAVYDQKDKLNLQPIDAMLLEKTYKGFVRSGALLNPQDQEEYKKLSEKLSTLTTQYKKNQLMATKAYERWVSDETELNGVPEHAKARFKEAAKMAGKPSAWLIKLSPPPIEISEYASNRALREEIAKASASIAAKGEFDNRPLVLDIIKTRAAMAKIMGFDTHASYILDNRMAKNSDTVMAFLERNLATYKPEAEKFLNELKEFAQKRDQLSTLQPWDVAYYMRLLKEEKFNIDMEALRPYFEVENVIGGLKNHVEKLFGITLTEVKGKYEVYHEDVKTYDVFDQKSGEQIGVFYADFHARDGVKKSGAWEYNFRNHHADQDGVHLPLIINVCNFAKPVAGEPSLLTLDDVRTIYHEFGHAMHDLLSTVKHGSLSGTSVLWDFVELPSQLQENWVLEKELLDSFAKHYKTGDLLDAETVAKISAIENFGAAYYGLRQTFLSMLDMAWHSADPQSITSVEDFEDKIVSKVLLFDRLEGCMTSTTFSHIFAGGYSAGYYSYKWAEVLDADVFAEFKKHGLYNPELGQRLRNTIYSQGGSVEPLALFKEMMGRAPDPDALFRREGLTPANDGTIKKQPKLSK